MKKRPTLYIIIIAVWLGCVALLGYALANIIIHLNGYSAVKQGFIISLLVINTAVLAILWFGSIKDFIFSAAYAVLHKKLDRHYREIEKCERGGEDEPRFLLLVYSFPSEYAPAPPSPKQ